MDITHALLPDPGRLIALTVSRDGRLTAHYMVTDLARNPSAVMQDASAFCKRLTTKKDKLKTSLTLKKYVYETAELSIVSGVPIKTPTGQPLFVRESKREELLDEGINDARRFEDTKPATFDHNYRCFFTDAQGDECPRFAILIKAVPDEKTRQVVKGASVGVMFGTKLVLMYLIESGSFN
ncbi:hypothetical protein NA57DRAFT_61567 [Rhizodiscina lignyota]|uniref:Uncharacterized protein n=1 Tax=Rhizodiscina lignyota TaxID=1504668 RepID=A0A9P4I7G9_9PEZI|nr:hypothetical protein NA57DRAFT_61567 [Rhizodiscina lignyota]